MYLRDDLQHDDLIWDLYLSLSWIDIKKKSIFGGES